MRPVALLASTAHATQPCSRTALQLRPIPAWHLLVLLMLRLHVLLLLVLLLWRLCLNTGSSLSCTTDALQLQLGHKAGPGAHLGRLGRVLQVHTREATQRGAARGC